MAEILTLNQHNIELISKELKKGNLASFPTDTVYGLGASAIDDNAILTLFHYKQRPKNNPLIVHLYNKEVIEENFIVNNTFHLLFDKFIKGGLTLILNKKLSSKISPLCSAGLDSLGFRIPNNETCLKILKEAKIPIVATSANVSNQISPTRAEHVFNNFKDKNLLIINDNKPLMGLESTLLDISDENYIRLLRYGAVSVEEITKLGIKINISITNTSNKNYTPKTKVKLNSKSVQKNEGLLAFGKINFYIPEHTVVLNLSEIESLEEASKNLFDMLIQLDEMNLKVINIMSIPNKELGITINQRLLKLPQAD